MKSTVLSPRVKAQKTTRRKIDFGQVTTSATTNLNIATTLTTNNDVNNAQRTGSVERISPRNHSFSSPYAQPPASANSSPFSQRTSSFSASTPSGSSSFVSISAPGSPAPHWAGGAYTNSPDPQSIPMPTFFGIKSSPESSPPSPLRNAVMTPASPLQQASSDLRRLLNIQATEMIMA